MGGDVIAGIVIGGPGDSPGELSRLYESVGMYIDIDKTGLEWIPQVSCLVE